MTMVLWILGMLLSWFITAYMYKKIEFVKMAVLGTGIYFSLYIVAAGLSLADNRFSVLKSLIIVLIAEGVITAALMLFKGSYMPKIFPAVRKYLPISLLLIAAVILSSINKSEAYGTGQDEGLYQIRAWYYMNDENDNVLDFSEYYNIESDTEKKEYIQNLNKMVGYYLLSDDDINDEKVSAAKGVTHGILTFPAILGLWGKMFGIRNMNGILSLMYILSIANVWLSCNNLKLKKYICFLSALIMTVCPIVLWSSRNVLTEIVLSMIISMFFELITEKKDKRLGLLTVIPIMAACFYHVTITIFIPFVVLVYFLMIFSTRQQGYVAALVIAMVSYVAGFFMMVKSSHAYTYSSFQAIFSVTKNMINEENLSVWVIACSSLVAFLGILLMIKPLRVAATSSFAKMQKNPKKRSINGLILCIICILIVAFSVYNAVDAYNQGLRLVNLVTVCYLMNTAFIFLPAALIGIFVNRKRIFKNKNYLAIYSGLLYILLIYCNFVWVLIYRYFYYSRYFTPFVCIVVIAGAIMLNKINFKIVVPVTICCAGILVWQSSILYTARDLTSFDYEVLESIDSCVGENDAVIMLNQGYDIQTTFALPVRAVTGADIYFAQDYDIVDKIKYYSEYYNDVYVLLYDVGHYTEDDGNWRYVYKATLKADYYDDYVEEGTPFPKETMNLESPLALMVYEGDME